MNSVSSHIVVNAPPGIVHRILLEPRRLADWNPAFVSITGPRTAAVGQRWPIQVRGGLPGHWEYLGIEEQVVQGLWQVPGLTETNSWELRPYRNGTYVAHTFHHAGPLAALLRPAFTNVADLRLTRLAQRAEHGAPVEAS